MKKTSLLFSIFCFVTICHAQIPIAYYDSAQGLQGLPLKLALHNIIKNHTSVTYASLWNYMQTTDVKPDGKVWDIYSDIPNGTPPYTFTFVSDQCGTYSAEGDCYNREHSWPQSWFNSASVPSSDMFHIYPTDGKVNGIRANYPYGEVAIPSITTLNGSMLGSSATAGYNGTVFEPIDEYKGDVARGYFYMCVRYYLEDTSWSNASNQMCNKSEIEPWGLQQLLAWHHQDTVSNKEIDRNNAIYQIQNNRNPFIDNPQWADSIWIPILTSIYEPIQSMEIQMQYDPSNKSLKVNKKGLLNNLTARIQVYNLMGACIQSHQITQYSSIDLSGLNSGLYIVQLSYGEECIVTKVLLE